MNIKEKIHSDLTKAILEKNDLKKNLLRFIIGELNRTEILVDGVKTINETNVIKVLRKIKENCELVGNLEEASIVDEYLPIVMNETQIKNMIIDIINKNGYSGIKDMGKVMNDIKLINTGNIDTKLASSLVKELLG